MDTTSLLYDRELSTIELTPDVVFERRSDVSSPNTSLSYASTEPSSLAGSRPQHQYADLLYMSNSAPFSHSNDVPSRHSTYERPYYNSDYRKKREITSPHSSVVSSEPPTTRKSEADAAAYGIVISIKDIKGHPFVILKDKEKQEHFVPAPGDDRVKTLPRNYGHRATDKAKPESPKTNAAYKSLPTQGRKARESSRAPTSFEKKSEQEKPTFSNQSESNQQRSNRSRSLSPKRASAYSKPNRSRSMSPPRNDRKLGRRVDIGSIKPVSHLIGYFEAGKAEDNTDNSSPGRGRVSRTPKQAPKKSSYSTLPSRKSPASRKENRFEAIERSDKYNVNEVVPSLKNVTTKPEGRYFALTSPSMTKYKEKKVDDGKATTPTSFAFKSDPPAAKSIKEKVYSPRSQADSGDNTDDSKSTTRISQVKLVGPSLHAADSVSTKTPRNAQMLSTTKTDGETSDRESESSESSIDIHIDIPKMEEIKPRERPIHTQFKSNTVPYDRKRPCIKFEKIKSEDTTKKKVEEMIVPIQKKHPIQHAAMSNAELQLKIGDLELYIKELQEEVENTMKNADQSQHQEEKEKFYVQKKQQVQELEDLRSSLLKMSVQPVTKDPDDSPDTALTKTRSMPSVGKDKVDESSSSSEGERDVEKLPKKENFKTNGTSDSAAEDDKAMFMLKEDIKKMKNDMLQSEREATQYKKELSRSRRQLEAQVNDLEEQLRDSDKRASQLQMKNVNLESKLSEMKQASKSETIKEKEILEKAEERAKEIENLRRDNEAKARDFRDSERKNSRLQEELRQMDVELEEELKECERHIVECRKVEQTARDLEANLVIANKNLAEKDKTLEELEGLVSSLKEKNEKYEKQVKEMDSERSQSERGLRDVKEAMKDKDIEVEELNLRNSELQKEINKNKGIMEELKLEGHDRVDLILSLKKKLNESDSKILNLQEDVDDLKHDKLLMQNEERRLREMIESRDDQIRDLIRRNEALQKNLEDKSAIVSELNSKLVRLETENAKLCKDIKLLEREVRLKELKGDKYNQEYVYQKEILAKMRAESAEKELALKNATEAIGNIDRKMKAFQKNHSLVQQENSKLETVKHEAESRMKNLQEETKQVERKYDLLRQESKDELKLRSELQIQVNNLNDILEEKTKHVNELADTVEDLRHQIDKLCQDNKRKEVKRKEELDDAMSRLEQEKRLLANELKMTKEDNEELEEKISEFEKMSMDASKEVKEFREEVQNLKDAIKEKAQLVLEAEDTIYQQKEVINELGAIQQSTEDSTSKEMEMFVADMQQQFEDLKKQMEVKNKDIENHQKEKESLTEEVGAVKDNLKAANIEVSKMKSQKDEIHSRLEEVEGLLCDVRDKLAVQQHENAKLKSKLVDQQISINSANDSHEKEQLRKEIGYLQDKILNLETAMQKISKENEILKADLHLAEDKLGYMQNEVEIERSRSSTLQEEAYKHVQQQEDSESNDGLVAMLENKIVNLEDKLEQEARELETITSHHRKTEAKLRDVLKQAEDETNRAISDRDMISIRNNVIKQQLEETEQEMKKIQESKREMEQELQQQIEANFKLQQMVAAVGFRKQPNGSSDGSSNLLTSV